MVDFAQKLMSAAQIWSNDELTLTPNPMARTILNRQKATFRVGLWPITSSSEDEIGIAMGIGVTLAALLELWPSVSVYRLVTQVSDVPESYQWKIEDTQFGVDDWEVEGLDENVALWGGIALHGNRFNLSLEVENDAREDDEVLALNYESATLAELLNQLPIVATKIMKWLNNTATDPQNPYEAVTTEDESVLKDFLEDIFLWEVDYFLELWGQGGNAEQVLASQQNLIELAAQLKTDFGAWLLSQSVSRFVVFDQLIWSAWLLPTVKETASSLGQHSSSANILGLALLRSNERLEAFDVLETSLSVHPEDKEAWITLGRMYVQSGEDLSAIDVYQRAIEAQAATSEIYLGYAGLMDSLVEHQINLNVGTNRVSAAGRPFIEQYIFADAGDEEPSLREGATAYQHVVELDSSNIDALAHLVTGLLSLDDSEAWDFCAQLIGKDKEGNATASVIEQLDDNNLSHMLKVLQTASVKNPEEFGVHLNLARVYLALDQNENAKSELAIISTNDIPAQFQAALARLRLAADDPDFDARVGEIQDVLDAKGQVSSEDVDYLETVVEKEPLLSEGYRLLAQSYLSWYESDDALEVLLDGQKKAPFDPKLVALLANVLWDADERDLALAYLDQGLNTADRNATLLSLMGRFLFENGEDNSAKEYLRRAEFIDPLNSELSATRLYIANTLTKSKKSSD